MTRRWSEAPIRVRVTAWYAGALALLLIVYAAVTYAAVRHEFLEQFDDQLHDDFETAESLAAKRISSSITLDGKLDEDVGDAGQEGALHSTLRGVEPQTLWKDNDPNGV